MAEGKIIRQDIIADDAVQGLDQLASKLKHISNIFDGIIVKAKAANKKIKKIQSPTLTGAGQSGQQTTQLTKDYNKAVKDLKASIDALNKTFKSFNQTTKQRITNQGKLTTLEKERKKMIDETNRSNAKAQLLEKKVGDAYVKAKVKLQQLLSKKVQEEKNEKKLTITQQERLKMLKQIEQYQAKANLLRSKEGKELIKQKAAYQKLNAEMMQQEKGQSGLIASFKRLLKSIAAYMLAYFAITRIVQFFTKTLYNQTKALDSLQFSMETVIKNSNELETTQAFLKRIAGDYGHDILTLTERYIKFRAATQQSNLSAKQTMAIFGSMAKAAGVLGLKTDEVNGVFLALEQMVSKGKVTTEELRRQLGERLPGAFGIMADSMGVSISKLDKMLKSGEVLTHEVLPGFAKAVEEAYGIETVKKIDTLIAAQGRLKTSWIETVKEISASKAYKNAIENWTNAFNRLRILASDTWGDGINLIDKYLLMTTKAGDAVRTMTERLDDFSWGEFKDIDPKKYINYLQEMGITFQHATQIWNDYYNIRQATSKLDEQEFKLPLKVDFDQEKKNLDQASEDFESYANLREGSLKNLFKSESKYVSDSITNERDYLNKRQKDQRILTSLSKEYLDQWEGFVKQEAIAEKLKNTNLEKGERARLRKLNKYYKQRNEILLDNFNNQLAIEIEINNRLVALDKKEKKGGKDTSLEALKNRQALELALTKKAQAELNIAREYSAEEMKQIEYDNEREILIQKLEDQNELRQATIAFYDNAKKDKSLNNIEIINLETEKQNKLIEIQTEAENLRAELLEKANAFRLKQEKGDNKELKRMSDDYIGMVYAQANELRIKTYEDAQREMREKKGNLARKKAIEIKAAIKTLEIEHWAAKRIFESGKTTEEEKAKAIERMQQLEEELQKQGLDGVIEYEQLKREQYQKTIDAAAQLSGQFFNITSQLSKNMLANLEADYADDVKAAGNSVERKIIAERRYEKEKAKIMKRQAIAEKAQAAFSIIINTAQAIMATLGQVGFWGTPLAAIIAAMGAAELAVVLKEPIPKYEKGIKKAKVPFIAGEKGSEAILMNGKMMLTPDNPTLYTDKALVNAEVIPHEETQRLLATSMVENFINEGVDMSETNRHLKKIEQNTSSKIYFERNGKTVIKRGYIESTIV